jgi:hypothetical protein
MSLTIFREKNSELLIDYSQLKNPNQEENTFLNDLFNLGVTFKKRIKYFDCKTTILKITNITSTIEKNENVTVKLNFSDDNFNIIIEDDNEEWGSQTTYSNLNGNFIQTETKIQKNGLTGNKNVEVRELVLSMLGITTDSLHDISMVDCSCSYGYTIPLHIFRILTHTSGKSWYIGEHRYIPECGLEAYEESAKFFRNLTLKNLSKLCQENLDDLEVTVLLDLNSFYQEVKECFEEAANINICNQEELLEISFSAFAIKTYNSSDEKAHSIFHDFISAMNQYSFMNREFFQQKKNILKKKIKATALEHFYNLTVAINPSKEINVMKFNPEMHNYF